jgi:RimJ/RimL family protein N-acetyltransferase
VELRPLNDSHAALLTSLQQQEDVWESIGTLPVSTRAAGDHVFAIMEGREALGFAGLIKSHAAGGDDFELLCALRSEAQTRGMAKQACQLVLDWAFQTAKLERVIACIDEGNQPARAIARKLGMTEVGQQAPSRIVYVKSFAESLAPAPPRGRQP